MPFGLLDIMRDILFSERKFDQMEASMNSSLLIYSPPYQKFLEEVNQSIRDSELENVDWFEKDSLRSKVYDYVIFRLSFLPAFQLNRRVVDSIWKTCSYTALVALTLIAPKESYEDKEDILQVLMTSYVFSDPYKSKD